MTASTPLGGTRRLQRIKGTVWFCIPPISSFAPTKPKAGFSKWTHERAKLHCEGYANWASREMHVVHLQLHNTRDWQKCQRLLDAYRTRLRGEHNFKSQVLFLHFRLTWTTQARNGSQYCTEVKRHIDKDKSLPVFRLKSHKAHTQAGKFLLFVCILNCLVASKIRVQTKPLLNF